MPKNRLFSQAANKKLSCLFHFRPRLAYHEPYNIMLDRINPNNAISRLAGYLINSYLGSFLEEVDYEKIQTQLLAGQISLNEAQIQRGATLHRFVHYFRPFF